MRCSAKKVCWLKTTSRRKNYLALIRKIITTRITTSKNVFTTSSIGTSASSFPLGAAKAGGEGTGGRCGTGIAGGCIAAMGAAWGAAWGATAGMGGIAGAAGIAGMTGRTKAGASGGADGAGADEAAGAAGGFAIGLVGAEMMRVYSPGPESCSRTGIAGGASAAGAGGISASRWINWVTPPDSKSEGADGLAAGWKGAGDSCRYGAVSDPRAPAAEEACDERA